MSRNEINRMLELVDEKYIAETEPRNNQVRKNEYKKRRNIIKAIILEATIFIIIGLGYILIGQLNNQESADFNYESLFKKNPEQTQRSEYILEAGGVEYRYDTVQNASDLPFDTSDFSKVSAHMYCDENGTPVNLIINLSNEEVGKRLYIVLTGKGKLFSNFDMDEIASERKGVKVYGCEVSTNSNKKPLNLFLNVKSTGYNLTSEGMSYIEMGKVLDGILEKGISLEIFDTAKATKMDKINKDISLEEAKELESFKERVSDLQNIQNMSLLDNIYYVSIHENDIPVSEIMYMSYDVVSNTDSAYEHEHLSVTR